MVYQADFWLPYFKGWRERKLGSGEAYREYWRIHADIPTEYRVRKTDFLRNYREFTGISKKAEAIQFVPHDKIPSERVFEPTLTYQTKRYLYEFEISGYDESPKEEKTVTRMLGMDELRKMSENEKIMSSAMEEHHFRVHKIKVIRAWRKY